MKESGVARKDIWLTSKLWNSFHQPNDVEKALDESLANLGTDYLDLYLMHWCVYASLYKKDLLKRSFVIIRPVAFKKDSKSNEVDSDLTENPYPTWQKLEEMVAKGKVRNIGISKYVDYTKCGILNLLMNDIPNQFQHSPHPEPDSQPS